MVTEQQDNVNRHRESGLQRNKPNISLGGEGTRRTTDQVETGQGCTPAGKDKDTVCLVRQALSPSGRLVL